MKLLGYTFLSFLFLPYCAYSQPKNPKLDSFDKLRQTILLQYIQQLGGKDSTGLYEKQVYYGYFEPPKGPINPKDEESQQLGQLQGDKKTFIEASSTYCNCQSTADIKTLPYRYFKQSHPREYDLITKDDFWRAALNSTAFFVYCPPKKGRKNQIIAAVWFWPSTRIGMISNMIPGLH